jgi:hypothetical protein
MAKQENKAAQPPEFHAKITPIKPGKYADGTPLHIPTFLCCKMLLKTDRLTSAQALLDYVKVVKKAAKETDVVVTNDAMAPRPVIREVLFLDTKGYHFYNNAFILRRRIRYKDGFPFGEPEIVFKYRHPDGQKAAEMDVRPQIAGQYDLKFKVQVLPLKDELGGYRLLYSHTVQFPSTQLPAGDRLSPQMITRVFPVLKPLLKTEEDRVHLVNDTIVEEVLQDLGTVDFGRGMSAKFNVAIWRERGVHMPLVGEFAFQVKYSTKDELHAKSLDRVRRFFITLQQVGHEYVMLGATKTGIVYKFKGNPPQAHE